MSTLTPDISYDYAHFTHDKLDRILPIAHRHTIGVMDFTLLALECYAEGFVATVLLEEDWRVPNPPPPREELEEPQTFKGLLIITEVEDDLGHRYTYAERSGSGGGGGESGMLTHLVYCFAPSLHPDAQTLSFTLTQVDRPRYDAHHRPIWSDDQVVGGPWPLSFPLAASSNDESAPVTVLPVAGHFSTADVSVTVTTLDLYSWGFVVNSRLDWASQDGPFPRTVWRATDDCGGDYGKGNCGGSGNRVGDEVNTWRMYCKFKPAIDPAATELLLRLDSLNAQQAVRSEAEDRFEQWETKRALSGLGELRVPLQSRNP